MDGLIVAIVVAALIIGALLMIFIQLTSRGRGQIDKEMYQRVWRQILRNVETRKSESMQMAIMKADKLLDKAMRDCGVAGETMGERMKSRKGYWSDENGLWAAHKLRNQIAHETNVTVTAQSFHRAMASFEQALKDLGAL